MELRKMIAFVPHYHLHWAKWHLQGDCACVYKHWTSMEKVIICSIKHSHLGIVVGKNADYDHDDDADAAGGGT